VSTTSATMMDLSLVSPTEERSCTGNDGSVSHYVDDNTDGTGCMVSDELCPMAEILCEKEKTVSAIAAKLEDAQRRVRHLDDLAKLGEMSAVVAHEIRNPLTGISATAEVLLDDIPVDDPRHESVRVILYEIQRLEKTVRNLLDFARDRKPFIRRVDLRDVVESGLAAVDHQAKERDITVSGTCPNDLVDAQADPELVGQAFTNVALNAIEAMPDGGELNVRLYTETDDSRRWVKVAVTDSGKGISKRDLEKIFDPFFTTKANGAGLGLAVSRKIVEAQNGFISAQSTPGKGATFVIGLPAA